MIPCLAELNEKGEWTGGIAVYCSLACREASKSDRIHELEVEMPLNGIIKCDCCNKRLAEPKGEDEHDSRKS